MAKTYVSVVKRNAVINVPFNTSDISELHSILLRNLDDQNVLDKKTWDTINNLCERIELCAKEQNQTESKEVNF
jgi:hypothetical protein